MKEVSGSTLSQHDKKVKRMEYEEEIRINKSMIVYYEDNIIEYEQALGGRGESSIIIYY